MSKSLKRNVMYNFIYQVLILILPFITAPYLSRTIGAEGVGVYSFSQSIALYFTYITQLGLNNYGNRTIASVQHDKYLRSKVFCEIYFMQVIMFIFSIVFYIIYMKFFAVNKISAGIMILWVISSVFDINWFFFGMEEFKLTVLRNGIIKVTSVICIFLFVNKSSDLYRYIFIMSISTLVSQICLWPYLKKRIKIVKPTMRGVLEHFKPNFILFIPIIAVSLYKIMDKVMLGYMSNMIEVGYYENAEKIITMIVSLIVAIGTVMLPRMSVLFSKNDFNKAEKYIDNTMLIVIMYVNATMFGLIAISNEFTKVYFGDNFKKSAIIMSYLAITITFLGIGNVIRTQYLLPNKRDKIFINSAIIGAIINVLINIILIPRLQSIGAAIGTIFAEALVCIYQLYKIKNEINLKRYLKYEIIFLGIGFFMFLVINPIYINNIYISLIVKISFGGLIYIALSMVFIYIMNKEIIFKVGKK